MLDYTILEDFLLAKIEELYGVHIYTYADSISLDVHKLLSNGVALCVVSLCNVELNIGEEYKLFITSKEYIDAVFMNGQTTDLVWNYIVVPALNLTEEFAISASLETKEAMANQYIQSYNR